jgi:hypothetical protein
VAAFITSANVDHDVPFGEARPAICEAEGLRARVETHATRE